MPFKSRAQEKWAFATKQPFAQKWADMTEGKKLPNKVSKKKKKKGYNFKKAEKKLGIVQAWDSVSSAQSRRILRMTR
jgi:hypothetical protein